jgi:hypothetical protein
MTYDDNNNNMTMNNNNNNNQNLTFNFNNENEISNMKRKSNIFIPNEISSKKFKYDHDNNNCSILKVSTYIQGLLLKQKKNKNWVF